VRNFVLLLVFFSLTLCAKEVHYSPFIDQQIELTLALSKEDITEAEVERIIDQKEKLFDQQVENVLANKTYYLDTPLPFTKEIYRLKKIIAINQQRGNKYAVVRDQVLVKSYKVLQTQHTMMQDILQALDLKTFDAFSKALNDIFVTNQQSVNQINDTDFHPYLEVEGRSQVVIDMKNRIQEYYAILEINAELLRDIINSQRKMYRLNKYYRYGLISVVLYINNTAFAQAVEPLLMRFNLSAVKVLLILSIIVFTFIFRKLLTKVFSFIFIRLQFKSAVIKQLLHSTKKPLDILTLTIAINLIFYIYNDFSRVYFFSTLFDEIYVVLVMWSIYKVLNAVATAKINSIVRKTTNVKSELINVTVKIINFTLILITVLLMLHLAGVNLTAILSGLGIGGFAIALAAKDSLANFFGTLSILMSDTFSQGDWIVVDKVEGVVVEIGLRVTTIRTFDNALISVPNSKLANEAIKNWNRRKVGRRIKFSIALRYDSAPQLLEKTLQEIKEYIATNPELAKEDATSEFKSRFETAKLVSRNDALGIKNTQLVMLDQLDDSSINILIYCFSKTTEWIEWAKVRDRVIFDIMHIVQSNGLDFAYPSVALYPQEPFEVKTLQ